MSRRHAAEKRVILPDMKYDSVLVAKFTNSIMQQGKKALAEKIPVTEKVEEKPLNYEAYAKENEAKMKAASSFEMSEEEQKYAAMQCSLDNPEGCEMCGS